MSSKNFLRGFAALLLFVMVWNGPRHTLPVQAQVGTATPEATPDDPGYQDSVARRMNLPAAWGKALSLEAIPKPVDNWFWFGSLPSLWLGEQ